MPARSRRQKRRAKKKGKPKKTGLIVVLFVLVLVPLFIFITTKFWKKDEKLSVAVFKDTGDVSVTVFDPVAPKITNILIPADMQVKSARQYGSWKIKNLRELGEDEGVDGKLVSESLMYYFKFPVKAWADNGASGFSEGGLSKILKAVFSPYLSNLGFGDKVKIGIFSLKTKNLNREDINVENFSVIRKTRLIDGGEGYVLFGKLPNSLYAVFSDPQISKTNINVKIINASKRGELTQSVGDILEVLGVKIAVTNNIKSENMDCEVLGQDKTLILKISQLFECESRVKDVGSFDFEIKLGEEFAKRH